MSPPLSDAQQEQLEFARRLFSGKTLVVHGGTLTAEAHESQRRTAVLEQLELAKKLRQQLEEAADKAESQDTGAEEIRQLILDQSENMNRLVSLQEALQNRYMLHDYEEYNDWTTLESERRQKQIENAEKILRDQVERMKNPGREWPSRIEVESPEPEGPSEQPEDSESEDSQTGDATSAKAATSRTVARTQNDDRTDREDQRRLVKRKHTSGPTKEEAKLNIRGRILAMQDRMQAARDQLRQKRHAQTNASRSKKQSREGADESRQGLSELRSKKRSREGTVNARSVPGPSSDRTDASTPTQTSEQRSKRKSLPSRLREETGIVLRPHRLTLESANTDVRPDAVSSAVPVQTAAPRRSKRPGPKKCHNCKTVQSNYLKCQFVLATGCRCGKTYCMGCLTKEYEAHFDPMNIEEYHCPACLGVCKCKPCQTQREKDERREALIQEMQRSKPKRHRNSVSRFCID